MYKKINTIFDNFDNVLFSFLKLINKNTTMKQLQINKTSNKNKIKTILNAEFSSK